MDRLKTLDFNDEVSEDEPLDVESSDDYSVVNLDKFNREEGRIYESIADMLPEEEEVLSYDDLVEDELNDSLGG